MQKGISRNEDMKGKPQRNARYSVQDCLNSDQVGRSVALTMLNGRTETGKLMKVGQYDIEIEMPNTRPLIVFKHSIVTVSLL